MKKRKPTIIPRDEHNISRDDISPEALKVLYRLSKFDYISYLCGGGVRDLLLKRKPKDFDLVTDATPNQIKRVFKNCRLIGRRFRLAHILFQGDVIEVATFRSNDAEPTQDQPDLAPGSSHMVTGDDGVILRDNLFGTPEEDANRRDFTINALFYDINTFSIIDYVGGLKDIEKRMVRLIGDPATRYIEDPVRMIRAVRFAATLDFRIERKTLKAIHECKQHIQKASHARMYEEVQKLLLKGNGEKVFELLRETGLFEMMFPDLSEWLTHSGDSEVNRIQTGLRLIDRNIGQGKQVSPALLYCMMLGEYIESRAVKTMVHEDVVYASAVEYITNETLQALGQTILVPRQIGYQIRHILESQRRFDSTGGKRPLRFLERQFFPDAFAYFQFKSHVSGENISVVKWWKAFTEENMEQIRTTAEQAKSRPKRSRGRGRRRPRRNNGGPPPTSS